MHSCLLLTLYLLLYVTYSLFPIIGRSHTPLSIRIGTGGGKRSKWVIHYNPTISRKAESIIPLLLLFKSTPSFHPFPPHPVMVDAHLILQLWPHSLIHNSLHYLKTSKPNVVSCCVSVRWLVNQYPSLCTTFFPFQLLNS